MMPQVSVIIPAYNTADYIQQAIASALNQTLTNLEVIVVDDASTDGTVEVVDSIQDPRLRLLVNPVNQGAGGSRNRALAEARGEWVAILDSDDWYDPQRLEAMLAVAQGKGADIVIDDVSFVQDGSTTPWSTLIRESGVSIDGVREVKAPEFVRSDVEGRRGMRLGFSKPLIKRQILLDHGIAYDKSLRVAEDFWFALECLICGAHLYLMPTPYYFYRTRAGSLSDGSQGKKLQRLTESCKKMRAFMAQTSRAKLGPELWAALQHKLSVTQSYRDYYRVVTPMKAGQWQKALGALLRSPMPFLNRLFSQVPAIFHRRYEQLFQRSSLTHERMS
ncbi:MAG: glycosyltransferase, partial [Cyanobacteria bacterium P01_A01_bin.135]